MNECIEHVGFALFLIVRVTIDKVLNDLLWMSSCSERSFISLSQLLMIASTLFFNSSVFRDFATLISVNPNLTASLLDACDQTLGLGGCTSLRGFQLVKEVAPPESTKAGFSVDIVGKDRIEGLLLLRVC